jgi:hypothetical protein
MPKPLMDESDPRMRELNAILVDYLTINLDDVSTGRLILCDALNTLLTPISVIVDLVKDIHLLALSILVGYVIKSATLVESWNAATAFAMILFFAISKNIRFSTYRVIFHLIDLASFGRLIKSAASGYQSGNVFWHARLSSSGAAFSCLGVYYQTLAPAPLAKFESFITAYRKSKEGKEAEFDAIVAKYWKEKSLMNDSQ